MGWKSRSLRGWALVFLGAFTMLVTGMGMAQSPDATAETVTAVPNRPTASTTAETVQGGVFEVEYGTELANGHQNVNGLNKFGATRDLEVRIGNIPIERDEASGGLGDTSAGVKYRFLHDREHSLRPSVAVLYTFTLPTSPVGIGIDRASHQLLLLVSKDLGKHHIDINEGAQWSGRVGTTGYDRSYFSALSYSHPLAGKWGYSQEVSGWSRQNRATPASVSVLSAATYTPRPRLVFDAGVSLAAMGELPRATFFSGVTYAFGRVRGWRSDAK